MALIECSECGRKVSRRAAACPSCGHSIKSGGIGNIGCAGMFVLAVFGGMAWGFIQDIFDIEKAERRPPPVAWNLWVKKSVEGQGKPDIEKLPGEWKKESDCKERITEAFSVAKKIHRWAGRPIAWIGSPEVDFTVVVSPPYGMVDFKYKCLPKGERMKE